MRIFVLLFVLTLPVLGAAAYAKAPADMGKPVCMRYDDSAKAASHAAIAAADSAPAGAMNTALAATKVADPANRSPAHSGSANASQPKGGGAADMGHSQSAPHWQTFLPGMFR